VEAICRDSKYVELNEQGKIERLMKEENIERRELKTITPHVLST
jgi:hypothetical protein